MNRIGRVAGVVLLGLLLSSCGGLVSGGGVRTTFDFGMDEHAPVNGPRHTSIAVADVEAQPRLDSTAMGFRLAYSAANQPRVYALSEWAMAPAGLVTQSLRARLAEQFLVAESVQSHAEFVLQVTLDEFTQVFDSPQDSSGLIELRATLTHNGAIVDQHTFVSKAPAASADAAGGARALAQANRVVVDELVAWVGQVTHDHPVH